MKVSLQMGTIGIKEATGLLEKYGPEYLRYLLQVSWAKPQMHSRLSSSEETVILIVLGNHEKQMEIERQKAQIQEFDRQHARHTEILLEARKSSEIAERSVESARVSAEAAEKSVEIARNALKESKRSTDATEQQARLALTAVGVSEEASKAAKESATVARKQFWLSVGSLLIAVLAFGVSIAAL